MLQAESIDASTIEVTLAEFGAEPTESDGNSTEEDDILGGVALNDVDSLEAEDSIVVEEPLMTTQVEEKGLKDGTPIPYNIASDNVITILLILCLIVVVTAFTQSGKKLLHQARSLFTVQRGLTTDEVDSSSDIRFQVAFATQTCLHLALVFFLYVRLNVTDAFALKHYLVILVFAVVISLFFMLRMFCYRLINWVFFDKKQSEQWQRACVLLFSIEGILLLPIVLLWSYFNLPAHTVFVATLAVVCGIKLLTFYKSFLMFFNSKELALQNLLYFCTLEGTPLVCLWLMLTLVSNTLIVQPL